MKGYVQLLSLFCMLCNAPVVQMCSPAYGLVHISWDYRHEVQYQLDCNTWSYFCEDSGWGDEEATVVCRQLGHSYGVSDYVPTSRVSGYINRIDCQGREEELQDCVIEPVSSGYSACTMIGTIAACYDHLPQVFMSVEEVKASEDESFEVCVNINGTLSQDTTVYLNSFDGSAIAGYDYVPVGHVLEFVSSGLLIKCVQIQLVEDHLTETEEWFGIRLSADLPSVDVIDAQLQLYIEPSDDDRRCLEGSVTAVNNVNNSSLQLVEMCSGEGVWSPVCDSNWTLQDATVVCRELGYRNLGSVLHVLGSVAINETPMIPECRGDEGRLLQCMQLNEGDTPCHYVLVDCTTGVINVEVEVEVRGNESGSGSKTTSQSPDNDQTKEAYFTILGIVSTTILLMMVFVSLSAAVVVGLCMHRRKRKNKVVPKGGKSGQTSQQLSSDYSVFILENSLYTNYHTTPLDSSVEHIYSSIQDPPPLPPVNHEYAASSPATSSLTEEHTQFCHELKDGDLPSIQHQYAMLTEQTP